MTQDVWRTGLKRLPRRVDSTAASVTEGFP